jgi:hypothetical protein
MQLTLLHGYPDYIGKRFAFAGYGNGPASYVNTGTGKTSGDPIIFPRYDNYIDSVETGGMISVSGTYYVQAMPSSVGPRATWVLRWFTVSTDVEVVNGTNLSNEQIVVSGLGGVY